MLDDLTFTDLLERRGIDPETARIVRHNREGAARWGEGRGAFEAYAAGQSANSNPYLNADVACQFIPIHLGGGRQGALFVGAHAIEHPTYEVGETRLRFGLRRVEALEDLSERVIVAWSETTAGTRTWSQWSARQRKPIVELRPENYEAAFPGFGELLISSDDLSTMPTMWRAALESVKGVYLLVEDATGKQYVGSAQGSRGFLGRWLGYDNGANGNKGLADLIEKKFTISILEVVSTTMSPDEIVRREGLWKRKLGSRVHGLNLN